ncbi:MAG: hypothetical protein ABSG73_11495 [Candidatus Aminicenantales bacterium]|jgi:hypothetical protein
MYSTARPNEAEREVLGWVEEVLSRLDERTREKVERRVLFVVTDEDRAGVVHRLEPTVRVVLALNLFECGREYALHVIAHELGHCLVGDDEDEAELFAEALGFPHPFATSNEAEAH